jgi:hypothetical protein
VIEELVWHGAGIGQLFDGEAVRAAARSMIPHFSRITSQQL